MGKAGGCVPSRMNQKERPLFWNSCKKSETDMRCRRNHGPDFRGVRLEGDAWRYMGNQKMKRKQIIEKWKIQNQLDFFAEEKIGLDISWEGRRQSRCLVPLGHLSLGQVVFLYLAVTDHIWFWLFLVSFSWIRSDSVVPGCFNQTRYKDSFMGRIS